MTWGVSGPWRLVKGWLGSSAGDPGDISLRGTLGWRGQVPGGVTGACVGQVVTFSCGVPGLAAMGDTTATCLAVVAAGVGRRCMHHRLTGWQSRPRPQIHTQK